MNSVLMQGMSPVASTTGSPAPATVDFLAVLADALAPSASPEVANMVAPELESATVASPGLPSGAPPPPPVASGSAVLASTVLAATVPPAEVARNAAIAYTATDAAADLVPVSTEATIEPALEPALDPAVAPAPAPSPDEPTGAPLDTTGDDRAEFVAAMNAAAIVVSDPMGRMAGAADPVDGVRDDSTPPEDRNDLFSRQPVGVGVVRPSMDMAASLLPQWNGRGPADVAAAVRPAQGLVASSRPTTHSAHGPASRPGWLPDAIGAQALVVRGDAALHALGQYALVGRTPGSQHVRPVTEQRAIPTAEPAPPSSGVIAGAALAAPVAALDGAAADDADRPGAGTGHDDPVAAIGDGALRDRTPTPVDTAPTTTANVVPNGAAQVRPAPAGPAGIAAQRTPHPGGLGMMGTDRVDRVRQQSAGRPVQRLTVDLDDARVAVRVRGAHVSVDVLSDPSSTLGQTWAHDVERTLETAMRAQETSSARMPVERDRMSTVHTSGSDQRNDRHHGSSSDGRGGDQSGREQRRAVPWWLTEEDE